MVDLVAMFRRTSTSEEADARLLEEPQPRLPFDRVVGLEDDRQLLVIGQVAQHDAFP